MAVVMIAEVSGLTEDVYGGMISQLQSGLKGAKGFISHAGGPSPDGDWRVVEMWESEADAQAWFEANVKPNLPPGVTPDRKYHEVHTAFAK